VRTQTTVPVSIRRVVLLLISAFVVIHFLVPQIAGVHRALYRLGQVDLRWLLLAAGLEVASILAYTLLTKSVLPRGKPQPRFDVLLRTQFSTLAVSHVVPGGTAAGGALGYRLLTAAGLSGTDTAFALATQSIGSAVVLNLLLWLSLVASIPLHGYNPLYGTAGVLGALLIAAFATVVVLLMRGEESSVKLLRAAAARLPLLDPDRVVEITRRTAPWSAGRSGGRRPTGCSTPPPCGCSWARSGTGCGWTTCWSPTGSPTCWRCCRSPRPASAWSSSC
jgi:uncharacterized membrane protein YbhN (UPF0104 family)